MAVPAVIPLITRALTVAPKVAKLAGASKSTIGGLKTASEVAGVASDVMGMMGGGGGGGESGPGPISGFFSMGGKVIDALSKGVSSAMADVQKAGAKIGGAILDALVGFLGQSGQGLKTILMSLYQGITSLAGQAFGAVKDLTQGGLKILSTLASSLSMVGQAFSGVFGAVFSIIGTLAETVGQFISRIGQVVAVLGETIGQVISGIVAVVQDCVNTARKMTTEILSIRNYTGMSTRDSANMYANFRGMGVSGNTITSMFNNPMQNPQFLGMRAQAFGMDGNVSDPKWIERLATRFQEMSKSGPMGRMQAIGMMESMGMNNAEMMRVVNMKPEQIREQQQWTSQIHSSFGLSPESIERIGERLGLLFQRFEVFAEVAKSKIVEGLLPTLEAGLEAASNFIAKNADKIVAGIMGAMEWVYAVLPALILDGAVIGLTAITNLMGALATMLEQFSQGGGMLDTILRPVARFWDMMIAGLGNLYAAGIIVWEGLKHALVAIVPPLGLAPLLGVDLNLKAPGQIAQEAAAAKGRVGVGHAEEGLNNLQRSQAVRDGAGVLRNAQANIGGWRDSVVGMRSSWNPDEKREEFKNLSYLKSIDKNTNDLKEETKKQNSTPNASAFHAQAYMEQMIVQGMRRARSR